MEVVKRLKRELKYSGALIDIYSDTVELPNGHIAHWDYIHHDGAAAVVPVREDGKILMVRQFRNALDRETLEIPAGKVDSPDEPKIQCAYRELEEETGYRSDNLEFLISVNTTVAFLDELIEIYVARDLVPTHQHLDEDEFVDVVPMDLDELCRMVYAGELRDGKTVAAIMAYKAKYGNENN
ncbi:MAG: NUDIX hydrolase [Lachnospiraceae bacterium]|nr:NUDIX hydrolase [Lachnospiraceae bacterium]